MKIVNVERKLVDKLVKTCSENIDGNKLMCNVTLNDYQRLCNSCTIYIVLLVIAFLIIIGFSSAYFYFHWYLNRSDTNINTSVNTGVKTDTLIY